ncbi:MAG: hypothetical protein SGPRY_013298 [Prymnesium sp.]
MEQAASKRVVDSVGAGASGRNHWLHTGSSKLPFCDASIVAARRRDGDEWGRHAPLGGWSRPQSDGSADSSSAP